MRRVRARDTQPERQVRSLLHRYGFRFRLHVRTLPGTPDIVLPRHGAVVLVHGCFWHGHGCARSKLPQTRQEFWRNKIGANRARDEDDARRLRELGWRILVIWECALRGRSRLSTDLVAMFSRNFLFGDEVEVFIEGERPSPPHEGQTSRDH
ncbi:very short patch repair endonuclease [Antarcticirhabdus aurantiaca]|uniref:Very short patch repair endonuclease n=1 Tax=Antarcticirhabdus aurantiaca TaxID=2606717 RepID=A0ACD4NXP4_9HYPH|nr:very short patch repair endonuclease [Antarcticirhabdus aurantiaca]WAJ31612.1 very short patch repair endonuclease [Jeongeuplla avenae]